MTSAAWLGILALAFAGLSRNKGNAMDSTIPPPPNDPPSPDRTSRRAARKQRVPADVQKRMEDAITAEAKRVGVPPSVALATAWVESKMDPNAEGDLWWHEDPQRFAAVPEDHPLRWNRKLWHSYGLFQLLAPYHVSKDEHPEILLDPTINIQRGVRKIGKLLLRYGTNLDKVRLAYTGASTRNQTNLEATLKRWHDALRRYGYDEPRP